MVITVEEVEAFWEQGYVVVEDVLAPEILAAVGAECAEIAARLVQGELGPGGADADLLRQPWPSQVLELVRRTGKSYAQHFDISLPPGRTVDASTPVNTGPAIFGFLVYPRLLEVVEVIVGPEIVCNPTQHLRMKLPESAVPAGADGLTSRVPWHQDNGVLLEEADDSHVLTVWAPLTPATEENGCLVVVPGSHRWPLLAHCPTEAGYAIPQQAMSLAEAVAVEMGPGSVLLMHQRTVHASGANRTRGDVRVSLDLRYQPSGEPSGRPLYPSFLVRSTTRPQDVLADAAQWAALWASTRARLANRAVVGAFFRWGDGGAACA